MNFNPISPQAQQSQMLDTRLNAQASGQDSCCTTALKIVGIAAY